MAHVQDIMRTEFIKAASETPLSKTLSMGSEDQEFVVVITQDDAYQGMLDIRKLLVSRLDIATTKTGVAAEHVAKLAPTDTLERAATLLSQTPHRALPVLEEDELVGVLYQTDLQKHFSLTQPRITVKIAFDAKLSEAIAALRDHSEHALLVTKNDETIGVITARKLLEEYYTHHITRDEGMHSRQGMQGFQAEKNRLLDMPIESFIEPIQDTNERYLLSDKALATVGQQETNRSIILTGFDHVSKFEMGDVEKVVFRQYDKLNAQIPLELKILLKTYNEKGSRAKHSMTFDGYAQDGALFKATSDAWNLLEALQEGLEKIEWQVRKHAETR